jgi:hypothetical protein
MECFGEWTKTLSVSRGMGFFFDFFEFLMEFLLARNGWSYFCIRSSSTSEGRDERYVWDFFDLSIWHGAILTEKP